MYMILDLYSRKITGYEVYETESGEQAAALMQHSMAAGVSLTWSSAYGPYQRRAGRIPGYVILSVAQK